MRIEAGESITWRAEEYSEAESKIVGGIARGREDVPGNTEMFVANFDKYFGIEELRLEPRY